VNKPIQLRTFLSEDFPIVHDWRKSAGQYQINEHAVTSFGVFAQLDGEDLACAWFYVNNRSSVAKMENLVTSPYASPLDVAAGVNSITNFFREEAQKIGKQFDVEAPFSGLLALPENFAPAIRRGDEFIDRCEAEMMRMDEAEMPVTNRFTPGLYIREIFIPAQTLLTSKIHKTEHPYVISQGDISVWTEQVGTVRLRAPHSGITLPDTRRILFAHEDTTWTTFHATDETDLEKIEAKIIEMRTNPLLEAHK
jgi:hypothetical protein